MSKDIIMICKKAGTHITVDKVTFEAFDFHFLALVKRAGRITEKLAVSLRNVPREVKGSLLKDISKAKLIEAYRPDCSNKWARVEYDQVLIHR